ncbi:MAG: Rieske 2Fe-2S domain-containing protein, partial [Acidimicrobiia bacterium]|nr:Rieske 2Fe-2S domain-containing protein [Acidimicrobiia bacterium]
MRRPPCGPIVPQSATGAGSVSSASPTASFPKGLAMMIPDPATSLHPVASLADLVPRHIVRSRLLDQELAIWRADDGFINIWADRCIHRGVRLSVGINDGAEVVCQYHGWRYSNRNGNCSYIPAHPGEAPARSLCVAAFASAVKYGLLWSGSSPGAEPPEIAALDGHETLTLRSLPVNAPPGFVLERLAGGAYPPPVPLGAGAPAAAVRTRSDSAFSVTVTPPDAEASVVFFVQPAAADRCVIRGVLAPAPPPQQRLAVLRQHAAQLEDLRSALESSAPAVPAGQSPATLLPLPRRRRDDAAGAAPARRPEVQVTVTRKWLTAEGIAAFELAPVSGELPSFQPGAHVDVHMPGDLVRQYSLTNGPEETG